MNDAPRSPRNPFPPVFALVLAFLMGVLLERQGWLPGESRLMPTGVGQTFEPFWEAWNLVERRYVDRDKVQPKRMTQGAIEGMLASLGDVGHTTSLSAEELEQFETSLKGDLEGIGARISLKDR